MLYDMLRADTQQPCLKETVMRYKIALICIYFLCNTTLHTVDDLDTNKIIDEHTNQTFMFTRPISHSISMNQAGWNDFAYESHKLGTSFQTYVVYAQSFENLTGREYFSFDHKHILSIRGGTDPTEFDLTPKGFIPKDPTQDQITTPSFNRDILGQWLNYNDVETATFSFEPRQRQAAGIIEFSQDLSKVSEADLFKSWYFSVRVPITYVSNNIGFRTDNSDVTLNALSNNNFLYNNVSTCSISSTRPSNAQFTLGTKYLNENDLQVITGMGVVVPLVEQRTGRYLFEPIHGFNAHFGFPTQLLVQFPLLVSDDIAHSRVCFFLSLENIFLARNKQMRTYDLKGKPYSRYLKLLDIHSNSIVPAMNVLTLRSRVEPFNMFNSAMGFRVKFHDCLGEIGYELWAHGTENVSVENKFEAEWQDDRYGIAFINEEGKLASIDDSNMIEELPVGQTGMTASKSTINYVASPDGISACCPTPTFTQQNKYITLQDLDLNSAAARSTITHKVYMSVTLGERGDKRDFFANLGIYIEAAQNNAALSMWGGWAKFGITF